MNTQDFVRVGCHACGAKYRIEAKLVAGKRFRTNCKHCGAVLISKDHARDVVGAVYEKSGATQAAVPSATKRDEGMLSTGEDWYLLFKESPHGPFSSQEIKRMLDTGKIGASTYAWRTGQSEWVALGQFSESFSTGNDSEKREPSIDFDEARTKAIINPEEIAQGSDRSSQEVPQDLVWQDDPHTPVERTTNETLPPSQRKSSARSTGPNASTIRPKKTVSLSATEAQREIRAAHASASAKEGLRKQQVARSSTQQKPGIASWLSPKTAIAIIGGIFLVTIVAMVVPEFYSDKQELDAGPAPGISTVPIVIAPRSDASIWRHAAQDMMMLPDMASGAIESPSPLVTPPIQDIPSMEISDFLDDDVAESATQQPKRKPNVPRQTRTSTRSVQSARPSAIRSAPSKPRVEKSAVKQRNAEDTSDDEELLSASRRKRNTTERKTADDSTTEEDDSFVVKAKKPKRKSSSKPKQTEPEKIDPEDEELLNP